MTIQEQPNHEHVIDEDLSDPAQPQDESRSSFLQMFLEAWPPRVE